MKTKKQLVILTTHFGTNFSGGSTATCEIFSRLQSEFEKVVVVGTQLGKHPFKNLEFIKYRNWIHATKVLKSLSKTGSVFYGDFYNSFLFIHAKLPFFFTYHDNWPEMRNFGFNNKLKSLFFTPSYTSIFKRAETVFAVSKAKENYIKNFTSRYQVVKNGFSKHELASKERKMNKVLMVGSIDERKYLLALNLFKRIPSSTDLTVDIFGHIKDQTVSKKLDRFPFVRKMGFHENIPYAEYSLLLHTSMMENLPLVFCESIFHNIPILAFDVGGSNEIVTRENGMLIPPYDISSLESSLKKIMSGAIAFPMNKEILKEHSWETASKKYQLKMLAE